MTVESVLKEGIAIHARVKRWDGVRSLMTPGGVMMIPTAVERFTAR